MLATLMVDVDGCELTQEEREMLQHPHIAGVILFARNYHSPSQLSALIQSIRAIRNPFLVAVDQEGGRVQRFRQGFTALAPLGELGKQYATHPEQAKINAYKHAITMANELIAFDIDFSFAPVLDVDWGLNTVIGNRSFSADVSSIIALASVYLEGMISVGMPTIAKHFPGHGGTAEDSHTDIAKDAREYDTLYQMDMQPFITLLPLLTAIMPAHVIYSKVDELPACFSRHWLSTVLRDQLCFSGAIISDDLAMLGASAVGGIVDRAMLASEAGCDMLLVCNNRAQVFTLLDTLPSKSCGEISQQRLQPLYRYNMGVMQA